MLTIRKEQMDVLRKHVVKKFEDRVVVHLGKFFPKAIQEMEEVDIRKSIHYGMDRAKAYGIDSERDVCKYIDLMYTFGKDFDKDPKIPWASKILNKKRFTGPSKKMDVLFAEAVKRIKQPG